MESLVFNFFEFYKHSYLPGSYKKFFIFQRLYKSNHDLIVILYNILINIP